MYTCHVLYLAAHEALVRARQCPDRACMNGRRCCHRRKICPMRGCKLSTWQASTSSITTWPSSTPWATTTLPSLQLITRPWLLRKIPLSTSHQKLWTHRMPSILHRCLILHHSKLCRLPIHDCLLPGCMVCNELPFHSGLRAAGHTRSRAPKSACSAAACTAVRDHSQPAGALGGLISTIGRLLLGAMCIEGLEMLCLHPDREPNHVGT